MITYTEEKIFTKTQVEELFLSINWLSIKRKRKLLFPTDTSPRISNFIKFSNSEGTFITKIFIYYLILFIIFLNLLKILYGINGEIINNNYIILTNTQKFLLF